jgi:hypothetical protein
MTGAHAVLHTHSRRLDFHPHVHLIVPAGAIHQQQTRKEPRTGSQRTWQWKGRGYLFPAANLARVFRAKWLVGMRRAGLRLNAPIPKDWVVDCKSVGSGQKALVYLGRYLYRGTQPEKDILSDRDGPITFRIRDNRGAERIQNLPGAEFLGMLLRHVLPKRFRPAAWQQPEPWRPALRPSIRCPHCRGAMAIIAVRVREIAPAPG